MQQERDTKPKYIGPSHDEGGIPATIAETGEHIEVEGGEIKICNAAYQSAEFYEFTDKTNEEILTAIHNINSCSFHPNVAHGGDWIICKAAVADKKKRNISGTIREILDIMQGEHGCKVSQQVENEEPGYKQGGTIEPEIKERWEKKKEHIATLANNIHRLRGDITRTLKGEDEKEKLIALAIESMFYTAERVGNKDSDKEKNHIGITGLKKKNVKCLPDEVILSYVGKSGVKHQKKIKEERLVTYIKHALKSGKGRYLFCTSEGVRITPGMINRFLLKYDLTSKDIRGYQANQWLVERLKSYPIAEDGKERKKLFNTLAKKVAAKVGHSNSILKNSYLAPELEEEYVIKGKIIDLKKLYADGGAITTGKGCLMMALDVPGWQSYLDAIAPEDLYTEEPGYGLETQPHVTIVYGFDDEKTDVQALFEKVRRYVNSPLSVKGISISLFENDAPYDVVKIDIESTLLTLLNKVLMQEYDIKSDFPDYHAHATIAYVKKGLGKKYVSDKILGDFLGTEIIYSHPDDSYSGTGKYKETFSLYSIKKVLYLKGYQDTTTLPLIEAMHTLGNIHILVPDYDYDKVNWETIYEHAAKERPDAIVGHSLGGYFAYYLSQALSIPALLLAPAMTKEWMEKQPIPEAIQKLPVNAQNKIAVIPDEDKEIPGAETFLQGKCEIVHIDGGHQINTEIFTQLFHNFMEGYLQYKKGGQIITEDAVILHPPVVLPIKQKGDASLKIKSVPLTENYPGLKQLIADMKKTVGVKLGIGLAAPQVGHNIRLIILAPYYINKEVLINPEIIEAKGEIMSKEGCMSMEDADFIRVKRPEEVRVKYLDENFKEHEKIFTGRRARIISHEIDHLDGILISDKVFDNGGQVSDTLLFESPEMIFENEQSLKEFCKLYTDTYTTECTLNTLMLNNGKMYTFAKRNEANELVYHLQENRLGKNLRKLLRVLKSA